VGRAAYLAAAAAAVLLNACPALAQDAPAPDGQAKAEGPQPPGSNPDQPTDQPQLRAFCTDRPTKANVACILDQGHWQVESDVANATFDHGTDTYLFTSPTLKYGLTRDVDLEAMWTPFEAVHTPGAPGQRARTADGVGDTVLRAKLGLVGQDGGTVAASLIPYVKAPTAPTTIGDGAWEGGLIAPVVVKLNDKLNLTFDPELDILKNAANNGRHAAMAQIVNLSYSLPQNVTVYGELWSDVDFDPSGVTKQYSADVAVTWGLPHDLQLDLGANVGLNRDTPNLQVYTGVSHRF
jgi:hypothetical protein